MGEIVAIIAGIGIPVKFNFAHFCAHHALLVQAGYSFPQVLPLKKIVIRVISPFSLVMTSL